MINIRKLETELWESADLLREGSKLSSQEYSMPVLGLIFLRYAFSRFKYVETEILKDIALGMTTKEIAEKRISSFHTINTHRKNIFRKLGVNNAHEATKYAHYK